MLRKKPVLLFLILLGYTLATPITASASLVAYWKFDESTAGSTIVDSSGNGNNGTTHSVGSGDSAPQPSTDVPSVNFSDPYSLYFDGTDSSNGDYIQLPSGFADFTNGMTITLWAKPTAANCWGRFFDFGNGASSDNIIIARNGCSNNFYYEAYIGGSTRKTSVTDPAIALNAWHYYTVTMAPASGSDSTVTVYVDGTQATMDTQLGYVPQNLTRTLNYIGKSNWNDPYYQGYIDDLRIYNTALTPTQVQDLSNGNSGPGVDATAPTSWLTVPAGGATIGGSTVTLTATSSDDTAVAGVTFYYDSTHKIGSEITSTSSPDTYTASWNASGLSSGSHTLIAVARDTSNNYATSTAVSVTVDNTAPVISATASSTSATGATATWTTDEAASTKVVYSLDSAYASSTSETDTGTRATSHSASLTGLLSCVQYNFKTVSADAYGNYATSTAYTFTTTGCPGGATPTDATSTSVTVASAATSTLTGGNSTITVATPANFTATSSSVIIQIKALPSSTVLGSIGKPSSSLSNVASTVFDVTALINNVTTLDSFDSPVTISYTYTDSEVSGLDESSLKMYHYHDGAWLELSNCSVDTSANTITCNAPSFSTFAIFGTPLSSSSSSSSRSKGGGGMPWCSGPSAPGWNMNLPDGGCGTTAIATAPTVATVVTKASLQASGCPYYRFTRVLKSGSTGEDVRALQTFLNCAGFPLGSSGPGSSGNETEYFAERTLAAVEKFQDAYATDVLAPLSLTHATGIFGTSSQKKTYSLMLPQ